MNSCQRVLLGFWLCAFGLAGATSVWAQEYPAAAGYVVDEARLIEGQDKQRIEGWLRELEEKTTAQVAVVTAATTGPQTIEEYAVKLFERWGIGRKKKDNGVLLLIAARDRKVRIEVGYGLEGVLTDVLSRRIINTVIVPEFKAGHFSDGVTKGIWAIVSLVAKEYNIKISGEPAYAVDSNSDNRGDAIWSIIFLILFLMLWSFSFLRRNGLGGGYWYGSYSGGGGFSGGGGGFSGGFSGGGGMSGGGGASGGW